MTKKTPKISRDTIKYGLVAAGLVIIAAGFLAPVGSYTAENSCLASETNHIITKRLTLVKGQTINKAKAVDSEPNACTLTTKYTLYVL